MIAVNLDSEFAYRAAILLHELRLEQLEHGAHGDSALIAAVDELLPRGTEDAE